MSVIGKVSAGTKRLLLGKPFRSDSLGDRLLPKRIALPVFASDALSSVAYAPEQIFLVLSMAGLAALAFTPWVGLAVAVVMIVVVLSYRQNVHAYPGGGGDYEVATVNLGRNAGLTVASALLVDYVLTVAVSISAAAANLASAFPFVREHLVLVAIVLIVVLAAINLRGVKESGVALALPIYAFMAGIAALLVVGLFRTDILGHDVSAPSAGFEVVSTQEQGITALALAFIVAKSFSSGCAALTGVQAIHNGVPAFRRPKPRNAAATLTILGAIAVTFLLGLIALASKTGVTMAEDPATQLIGAPAEYHQDTLISQLAEPVFSFFSPMYFFVMAVTAIILALAANTAFNGFPTLGSVLARDAYLPRQLANRGNRLAYSNGIILLALLAIVLVLVFQARVAALIQLYIVGVFVAFTISQIAMVRHWNRHLSFETDPARRRQIRRSRVINTVGCVLTSTVLVIVMITKFFSGAWIAVAAMLGFYVIMKVIRRHYDAVSQELAESSWDPVLPSRTHCVVLVSKLHRPTIRALAYARATQPDSIEAITVNVDTAETRKLVKEWSDRGLSLPLKVIESPYREINRPVVDYVKRYRERHPRTVVSVYIPEYVVGHWWESLLHNQSALRLKTRLLYERGVMVTSVPWQLESSEHRELDDDIRSGYRWGGGT